MDFRFDTALAEGYQNKAQKVRLMSESWMGKNMYCPVCGNPHLSRLQNNMPVADFQCDNCGDIFELKSKNGNIGSKLADGAYDTMIARITGANNPDLFIMQYTNDLQVIHLSLVPKFFFTPAIIEKRKPLSPSARRAGWVGCNILYSDIPRQGRIPIIRRQQFFDKSEVLDTYKQCKKLETNSIESRGWLFDILNCINSIENQKFSLSDMYEYSAMLQSKHIDNHNIEAKIRQQLQILRNKGVIAFIGKGKYQKLM